jgi:hypothetical protein
VGAPQTTVTVEVTEIAEPISGQIQAVGQAPRPFTGWLQLLSALQDAVGSLRGDDSRRTT